jgi:hypothetical protein
MNWAAFRRWIKALSFDIDQQLEYMDMLNSYMVSGEYKTKEAVFKVKASYLAIYGPDHIAVQISDQIITSLNVGGSYVAVIKQYFTANIAIGYELSQRASINKAGISGVSNLVKIERGIRQTALSTLLQPGVMALLAIIANAGIGQYLIPALESANRQGIQNSVERTVSVALGHVVFDGWPLLLLMMGGLVALYSYLQRHLTGPARATLDKTWPFLNYRTIWGIRVMKLVGLLKQAGVRDIDALTLISTYGSPFVRGHLETMIYAAKTGRGKAAFGIGLLSDVQLVRLSASRSLSDEQFTRALLHSAEQSTIDIKLQNRRAIKACGFLLYLVFFIFGGLSVGAIFKTGMGLVRF